jgi:hypothetical protein
MIKEILANITTIAAFILGFGSIIYAYFDGRKSGENKTKIKSLTDTMTENEETRKSQTKFNDLGDADKSKWLLRDMEERNKDSKRFLR